MISQSVTRNNRLALFKYAPINNLCIQQILSLSLFSLSLSLSLSHSLSLSLSLILSFSLSHSLSLAPLTLYLSFALPLSVSNILPLSSPLSHWNLFLLFYRSLPVSQSRLPSPCPFVSHYIIKQASQFQSEQLEIYSAQQDT